MKMNGKPLVILNFKTYLESTGLNALKIAKASEEVADETGVVIAVATQAPDLWRISREVNIPVFAQHVDAIDSGGHTGSILLESVKQAGAQGTLINHSEQRMELADMEMVVKKLTKPTW